MNIITTIIKFFINCFSSIIKKNKGALKYLFMVSLKDEIVLFYENEYLTNYAHIDKAISLAKQYIKKGFLIIDVGGADGVTPRIFSKSFPDKKILIFEPIKENYTKIKSLITTFPNFILVSKAAGNFIGKTNINIANRITSSSIFNLKNDNKSDIFSNILEKQRNEEIEVTTLDSEVPLEYEIGILKIDVQGYELEVLKGSINTLPRTSIIVLELNNHNGYENSPKYFELDHFLRNENFTLYDIFPSTKDKGRLKEWDSIYINNRILCE